MSFNSKSSHWKHVNDMHSVTYITPFNVYRLFAHHPNAINSQYIFPPYNPNLHILERQQPKQQQNMQWCSWYSSIDLNTFYKLHNPHRNDVQITAYVLIRTRLYGVWERMRAWPQRTVHGKISPSACPDAIANSRQTSRSPPLPRRKWRATLLWWVRAFVCAYAVVMYTSGAQ